MANNGFRSVRGIVSALLLGFAGLALGWLCFRTTIIRILPTTTPLIVRVNGHDPSVVLTDATVALIKRGGQGDSATLPAVRRAAAAAPLDARPYLLVGSALLNGDPARATATLEAGQRLDPRLRLIHSFLLERYLRTGQYAEAAAQFSVLSRLVGTAQQPIAKAFALMSTVPEMRGPVRRTLRTDPGLEQVVLTTMANGNASPAGIFALASPIGLANAGVANGWGSALVTRLVANGQYAAARSVWQRIYRLSNADAAALIFNPRFAKTPASAPFNWALQASTLGAADPRNGGVAIDYYGRDSGDLATQLLTLKPGRYRFSFVVEEGKTVASSQLSWVLTCHADPKTTLMNAAVAGSAKARQILADVTVPLTCPAQVLALRGEASEFPVPVNVTVRDIALRPLAGALP